MKLSDRTSGLALAALGAVALQAALRLPPMAGQPVGPSAFPSVVGAGLILCGLLIAGGVGRSFEARDQEAEPPQTWTARAKVLVAPALLVLYVLLAERVGFVALAAVLLTVMARTLGARWRQAVALALIAPPLVHLVFAKLLRVPLPAGWLPMPW